MVVPITFLYIGLGLPYYLTWMAFGHVIGVYSSSSSSVIAGIAIHLITAISIGIAVGIFLYKTGILNISKLSNGLLYGLLVGSIVFVAFFIPVYQFILAPEITRTMAAIERRGRLLEQDLQDTTQEVDVARTNSTHLFPEAARREMPDHREGYVADQGQRNHLRAADVVERLPHEHDVVRADAGHERDRLTC